MDVCCSTVDTTTCGSNRAVLEGSHDGVLHFHLGASVSADGTRVGDRNVAVDINGLVGNGSHPAFGRNEEASRSRFEDRDAKDIADTERDGRAAGYSP